MRFVWKHALTNAIRLWRETLPLLLVTLIAAGVLSSSTMLARHSRQLYDAILEKYEVMVTLQSARPKSQTGKLLGEKPQLLYSMMMELADDPAVKVPVFTYDYPSAWDRSTPVWAVNFKEPEDAGDVFLYGNDIKEVKFYGITDARYSDASEITSGRGIFDTEGADYGQRVVMISETLAAYKNLTVGDTLHLTFTDEVSSVNYVLDDPFTVIGIYKDNSHSDYNWRCYIPLSVLQLGEAVEDTSEIFLYSYNVGFLLNSPDMAADFITRAREKIGDLPLALEANDFEYKRETYPSAAALELNEALQVVTEVTGILLTVIISLILIRLRRREMMILRTVTGRRLPGMAAYVMEKAIVSLAGALLGGLIGCGVAWIFFTEGTFFLGTAELLPLCGSILIPPLAAILTAAVTAGINALTTSREAMSSGT